MVEWEGARQSLQSRPTYGFSVYVSSRRWSVDTYRPDGEDTPLPQCRDGVGQVYGLVDEGGTIPSICLSRPLGTGYWLAPFCPRGTTHISLTPPSPSSMFTTALDNHGEFRRPEGGVTIIDASIPSAAVIYFGSPVSDLAGFRGTVSRSI